jgi:hypothetical protein
MSTLSLNHHTKPLDDVSPPGRFRLGGIVAGAAVAAAVLSGGIIGGVPAHAAPGMPALLSAAPMAECGLMDIGVTGTCVQWLQQALNSMQGERLLVDGIYGRATKNAVVRWQRAHGLVPDGRVGEQTKASLRAADRARGGGPVAPDPCAGRMTKTGSFTAAQKDRGAVDARFRYEVSFRPAPCGRYTVDKVRVWQDGGSATKRTYYVEALAAGGHNYGGLWGAHCKSLAGGEDVYDNLGWEVPANAELRVKVTNSNAARCSVWGETFVGTMSINSDRLASRTP